MSALHPAPAAPIERVATPRRYLMCPPEYFEVRYAINPWMDPSLPVDRDLAHRQWDTLRQTYLDLGHSVDLIAPEPGLPDMVFAANNALVLNSTALGARFAHPERRAEEALYLGWLERSGLASVTPATYVSEGEGDFLVVAGMVLAGMGFRTDPAAHTHVSELFDVQVVSLELVDPCIYHLDAAVCVLDERNIAYYPGALSAGSRDVLRKLFPDAVLADASDAAVLGVNAVSDGRNVVMSAAAPHLERRLRERGYHPIEVDLSELLKAGGGVKCCTLELRA